MTESGPQSQQPDPAERLLRSIEAVQLAVRRQSGTGRELGPKAERTRGRLLAAAREVFAERDYLSTSAQDIADRANVSLGTFYQYFSDLNGIVMVLAGEHIIELLQQHVDEWDPQTGRIGLRRVIAVFLHDYFANVAFFRLWEQATAVDPRIAEIRRPFWAAYKHQIARSLAAGMKAGTVRADIDPLETARALTHMMQSYCYDLCIFDPPPEEVPAEAAADLLATLWADAIGLTEPSARWAGGPRSEQDRPGPGPQGTGRPG
jgi:AcrR family transcriptional regulator